MLDLSNHPVVYVTRDVDRALGLSETDGYTIISNDTPENRHLAQNRQDVIWIKEDSILDTHEILTHPSVIQKITNYPASLKLRGASQLPHFAKASRGEPITNIVVFKNTTLIEKICKENGWNLLNPSAELSKKVEEKITQVEWLAELSVFLPPHAIKLCKEITLDDLPCIVQFNHAHTGEGTLQLEQLEHLEHLQHQFPDRPVRVTKFINGMMFTNNNIITTDTILVGNINYQITGIAPYTQNKFQTIGNDWGFAKKILSEKQIIIYNDMVQAIGDKLRKSGWNGLFGIDVILEEKTEKLYLIEINARQPASTTYESILQNKKNTEVNIKQLTTFEAHLLALLKTKSPNTSLIKIDDGAQLYDRRENEPILHRFEHSIIEEHGMLMRPLPKNIL